MSRRRLLPALFVAASLVAATPFPVLPERDEVIVTGRVTTEAGQPLFGANVTIDAFASSVGTTQDGRYRIVLPSRARDQVVVVRARAIGYVPVVKSTRLAGDSVGVDFMLKQDVNHLSQVVVTGAGASALYSGGIQLRAPSTIAAVTAGDMRGARRADPRDLRGESYERIVENPYRSPHAEPLSTFGVDVDRASYSNVRRIITVDRQHPPADAVRIEELLNYFTYDYPAPTGRHPFAVATEVARAPWAPEHLLVRIGLQARTIDLERAPANNLVFLIDVSGSMGSVDKLPLLKDAFRLLVDQLREQDRVAIVVYAGAAGLVLGPTSGADKVAILGAIDRLESGGSTAGGEGLRLAYDVARSTHLPHGNNRVILATDGDFNVGVTSNGELERMVETRREEGTALTVLGFGAGNLRDDRMQMLADRGNGNYAYIDSPLEARKVLVQEMGGTLVTVAKDVKLQVEFNPALVAGYRLLGYENRMLAAEDFKDDRKDAGDMGAGHSVTALYEVIPVGAKDADRVRVPDGLRYSRPARAVRGGREELALVKLRYKEPRDSSSVPFEVIVPNRATAASDDFRFAQAVAAFGLALRKSEYRGDASAALALELAEGALGRDVGGYRADFLKLLRAYGDLPASRTSEGRR